MLCRVWVEGGCWWWHDVWLLLVRAKLLLYSRGKLNGCPADYIIITKPKFSKISTQHRLLGDFH